jgi:hypothetical protein
MPYACFGCAWGEQTVLPVRSPNTIAVEMSPLNCVAHHCTRNHLMQDRSGIFAWVFDMLLIGRYTDTRETHLQTLRATQSRRSVCWIFRIYICRPSECKTMMISGNRPNDSTKCYINCVGNDSTTSQISFTNRALSSELLSRIRYPWWTAKLIASRGAIASKVHWVVDWVLEGHSQKYSLQSTEHLGVYCWSMIMLPFAHAGRFSNGANKMSIVSIQATVPSCWRCRSYELTKYWARWNGMWAYTIHNEQQMSLLRWYCCSKVTLTAILEVSSL